MPFAVGTMKRALGRLVDRRPSRTTDDTGPQPEAAATDIPHPPTVNPTPPRTSMHSLTVETIRLLTEVGINHADSINPNTAQSLEYCLTRMQRYAHHDWAQIRDLQPLLIVLRRRNPRRPLTFP